MLNVTLLVPESRRATRVGLVGALTEHYGIPSRLADYRRQFERTTRTAGEDPTMFAMRWRHWRSRHLETWAKQRNFASYTIDLLLVMIVVSCADIWIVHRRRLPAGIL